MVTANSENSEARVLSLKCNLVIQENHNMLGVGIHSQDGRVRHRLAVQTPKSPVLLPLTLLLGDRKVPEVVDGTLA